MKERLINEYVNRMNLDDVNKFALQNGINLKDDELRLIFTYIKNCFNYSVGDVIKIVFD